MVIKMFYDTLFPKTPLTNNFIYIYMNKPSLGIYIFYIKYIVIHFKVMQEFSFGWLLKIIVNFYL